MNGKPELNQKVIDAISVLMSELNNISSSGRRAVVASITERIRREHRTLQQAFWSMILLAQIEYADSDSDLRNEQAVKLAKLVKEVATANNMDMGLPFI